MHNRGVVSNSDGLFFVHLRNSFPKVVYRPRFSLPGRGGRGTVVSFLGVGDVRLRVFRNHVSLRLGSLSPQVYLVTTKVSVVPFPGHDLHRSVPKVGVRPSYCVWFY